MSEALRGRISVKIVSVHVNRGLSALPTVLVTRCRSRALMQIDAGRSDRLFNAELLVDL